MKCKIGVFFAALLVFSGAILLLLSFILDNFNNAYGIILTTFGAILNLVCIIINTKHNNKKMDKSNQEKDEQVDEDRIDNK